MIGKILVGYRGSTGTKRETAYDCFCEVVKDGDGFLVLIRREYMPASDEHAEHWGRFKNSSASSSLCFWFFISRSGEWVHINLTRGGPEGEWLSRESMPDATALVVHNLTRNLPPDPQEEF